MIALLDAERMRKLDRYTIETVGLPGAVLMETAGRGAFACLMERFGELARRGSTLVVCGTGNNGGDGFVVARCLLLAGCAAQVVLLGRRADVRGDAAIHLGAYLASGGKVIEVRSGPSGAAAEKLSEATLLVDAIFGTGLARPVEGVPAAWITRIGALGRSGVPVVSLDLPSGVSADNGAVLGMAISASLTVTFGHWKKGHYLQPGAARCGRKELVDIGIPPGAVAKVRPDVYLLESGDFANTFRRSPEAHKGHFGHVAVLAGGRGKMGAAALAAWAALRSGSGLSTAGFPAGLAAEARFLPEVMTEPLEPSNGDAGTARRWTPDLVNAASRLIDQADALVVGPGMGLDAEAEATIARLLARDGLPPVVLDADALTLLARRPGWRKLLAAQTVLTPHPGEAARLLGIDAAQVQNDRPAAASALAKRFKCTVVLKGAGTLVASPSEPLRLVPGGNPGMATAGAGDVLSGVVGSFLGRGLPASSAAAAAAYAHALAGDFAAETVGQESMTASDILMGLAPAMRQLAG
jgi:NAD(P)H-hydrate epimerase